MGEKLSLKFKPVHTNENVFTCGVPQGSVLELLLFIFHINDVCTPENTEDKTIC